MLQASETQSRPAPSDALLSVEDLRVSYGGGILALQGVSLHVKPGEVVALVGANGAGKTTLMKTIAGLLQPVAGQVRFNGQRIDVVEAADRVKAGIALVPEGRRLFSRLKVVENLTLGSYLDKNPQRRQELLERIYGLFPILKERAQQRAGTFSGGQQQMLAIARALMSQPTLLMLDEPSLGIAPLVIEQIFGVLRQLKEQGHLTMLLVEQNVHAALRLADRGYVIQTGRIVLEGTSEELLSSDLVRKAYLGI